MAKFDTKCPDCQTVYTLDSNLQRKVGICQFCRTTFILDPVNVENAIAKDEKTHAVSSTTILSTGQSKFNDTSFSLNADIELQTTDFRLQDKALHANPGTQSLKSDIWDVGEVIFGVYEVRPMPNGRPYSEGGVGIVHHVYHREWDIELAVKSPKSNIFQTEVGRQNYERECKTWIDLGLHPNIVTCYLARRINGIPRLFAELMLDGSLSDWVRSGRLYQGSTDEIHRRIFDIAIQFSWGLDYAHRQGLLHLDIKPANVMLSGDAVKVTDFGLSRAVAAATSDSGGHRPKNADLRWEGMTPGYCSPEQYQSWLIYQSGNKTQPPLITAQSDMWSWAISVLTMYYGRPPCKKGGQTAAKTFEQFLKLPPSPSKPLIPEGITELLRHCFQWEPEQRPGSMAEISDRLVKTYRDTFREPYFRKPPVMTASTTESLNNRAASLIDLGELKQAEDLFGELVRRHAWHPQALYNKTLMDWRTGKIADLDATHQVESLTNLRPNDATSWYALALVQRERGNIEDARHAMQRVIDIEPKKEYQRHFAATNDLLEQNTRCIERFRICPLKQPFVYLSEEENLILFAMTPEVIGVYDTGTGGVYTRFRKNRIGSSSVSNAELLFAQKPMADNPPGVSSHHKSEDHSGLLHEMLFADATFSVLSDDTNWELYCGHEPGQFFLRKTHEDAQPITFRTVRWNTNEEHGRELLSGASGHTEVGMFLSVHTTADGTFAVTGGNEKSVRLWELESRRCVRTFLGGEGYIHSVFISQNRKFTLSLADQCLLKIWNTDLLLNEPHKLRAPIMLCLVASSEVVSQNQSELAEACQQVETLAASGDIGNAITTLDKAKKITGWETRQKEMDQWKLVGRFSLRQRVDEALCYGTWSAHGDIVSSVAMSIDGKTAASSGREPVILVWDLNRACCVRELCGHADWVRSVDLTSDGRFAVSASWDQTVRLWNVEKGEMIRTFGERLKSVCCVAFSPSARTVAATTATGQVYLFDPVSGNVTAFWPAHNGAVNSLRFCRDGRFLVTGSDDGKVVLWDVAERGRFSQTIAELSAPVMAVGPSTILSYVAVASQDGLVRICSVGQRSAPSIRELQGHLAAVNSLLMTPDDRWIISGSKDKTIRIWNVEDVASVKTLKLHSGTVSGLAVDYSAMRLVSVGEDATVRGWNIEWGYEFPGWREDAPLLDEYVQTLINVHSPKANISAIRSGVIPTEMPPDERLFRAVRAELEFRGFGWIKPDAVWKAMLRCAAD